MCVKPLLLQWNDAFKGCFTLDEDLAFFVLLQCRYCALQEANSCVLLECLFLAMIYIVRTKLKSDSLELLHKS